MVDSKIITTDLAAQITQSSTEIRQLEAILARVMQVLNDNGFQVAVDIVGLAHTISDNLEQAQRSTRAVSNQLDQMTGLLRTFSLITSSLDLDIVLSEVMDTVIALTGAERAYLVLREVNTGQLDIAVARNWDRESLSEDDAGFSRSVVQRAMEQGEAIITTNAATDDRFQNVLSVVNAQLRSILCIPLMVRGEAQGVLYADNRITQNVFRQDEIPLLTAFGTQAAIAIENARAYGRVKEDLTKALNELQSLQIAIDRSKLDRQVSEITDTDYFQRISSSARNMRGRYNKVGED
ncbi:MAG: GAF domain-containing protein [Anaerolineae bacterium]|nr:GAF domain-containing protein [Anaerolineae bacterium]